MSNLAHNVDCDLLKTAERFLENLKPGPLAIAVSGGSDSLGVLHALIDANQNNRKLICLSVDHGLRKEAAAETEFVARFCRSRNIECKILKWNGIKPSTGIQNAARKARYKLLIEACLAYRAIGLVSAHNLDDQLETVFMRAQRDISRQGRGLSGMASMSLFFNKIWVLRPFLKLTRQHIQTYLLSHNLNWIEDPSNKDERYERVRVRNDNNRISDQHQITSLNQDQIEKNGIDRVDLSTLTVKYLQQNCTIINGLYARITLAPVEKTVLAHALETIIDVIGGRKRTLGTLKIKNLVNYVNQISSHNHVRITMGRTIIEKKDTELFISRENRGIYRQWLSPRSEMLWDGRFKISNLCSDKTLIIIHDSTERGCPPIFAWQSPVFNWQEPIFNQQEESAKQHRWFSAKDSKTIKIERYINRFDNVLPLFELNLADEIARQLGRKAFLGVPLQRLLD